MLCVAGWKPGDPIPGVEAESRDAGGVKSDEPQRPRQQSQERTEMPMFELILNPEWEDAEEEFSDDDDEEEEEEE